MKFQPRSRWALRGLGLLLLFSGTLLLWKPWPTPAAPTPAAPTPALELELELSVMSFNIRNGHAKDGDNRWALRKDFVGDVIGEAAADVVGLQEAYRFQLDQLLERLPQYDFIGSGRDGGASGEYSAILYRRDRFEVVDSGTFWLSQTPQQPSISWDHHHKRICTWARLRDRHSGRSFSIHNTHMDHQSAVAREKGARLIMQTLAQRGSTDPLILCGDFNAGENSSVLAYLKGTAALEDLNPIPLVDSWRVLHPDEADCGTVSRFKGSMDRSKIDYVMVPPDCEVLAAAILRPKREGRDPSDHYPVTARLRFR